MARKTRIWLLFLFLLFLLSLAASPYSKAVDMTLIGARLTLVAVMSVLTLREWLRHQRQRPNSEIEDPPAPSDSLLRRLRRWYFDR
jgi:hypothetical protein